MHLLGISGALRAASTNSALVRAAAEAFAPDRFTFADIDLPLYNGDVEAEGYPEKVEAFVEAIRAADAIVISGPEYNKNISGVLKNALDWQSRFSPAPLKDKPVAIMSATAGQAGGELTQMSLRKCLMPFNARVIWGPFVFVGSNGRDGLFEKGELVDEGVKDRVAKLMDALREMV